RSRGSRRRPAMRSARRRARQDRPHRIPRRPGPRTTSTPGTPRPSTRTVRLVRMRPKARCTWAGRNHWGVTALMTDLAIGDSVFRRSGAEPLQMEQIIGRGGQGTVFRTALNGRPLAVKWYRASDSRAFDAKMLAGLTRLVDSGRPRS